MRQPDISSIQQEIAPAGDLRSRLTALESLLPNELRAEWRRLYRTAPPRLSRDLMIRAIAYRMQEITLGGLSKSTKRKLASLAEALQTDGRIQADPKPAIKNGARLVREWHGRTHTVTVKDDGFEYRGRTYASLTRIAREITGAHWSGPRFFGLARNSSPKMAGAANVEAVEAGDA